MRQLGNIINKRKIKNLYLLIDLVYFYIDLEYYIISYEALELTDAIQILRVIIKNDFLHLKQHCKGLAIENENL